MATDDELRAIREMGRRDYRRDAAAGLVPPLSEEQVQMLRDFGCPSVTRKAVKSA